MTTIYKNRSNGRLYALNACLMQGNRVNIIDMKSCEDKFISPSTLKRNYIKWDENVDVVEVRAFTGMKIGLFKATRKGLNQWDVCNRSGKLMEFDFFTGKQTNANNPKYANQVAYNL